MKLDPTLLNEFSRACFFPECDVVDDVIVDIDILFRNFDADDDVDDDSDDS